MEQITSLLENFSFEKLRDNAIVGIFGGVGVAAVFLLAIASFLQSWLGAGKATLDAARALSSAVNNSYRNPRRRPVLALILSIVVVVAQLATLGLCFMCAQYIKYLSGDNRYESFLNTFQVADSGFRFGEAFQAIQWEDYSTLYVAAAAAIFVWSHIKAWSGVVKNATGVSPTGAAFALALPASVAGASIGFAVFLIGPFLLLLLLLLWLAGVSVENYLTDLSELLPMLTVGAICAAFYGICYLAVKGSLQMAKAWNPSAVRS